MYEGVKNMRRKKTQKIVVWIMTLLMVGSVVASILVYFIRG